MFGTGDSKILASHVGTKTANQVMFMLRNLRTSNRREIESQDMRELRFVELNGMDDLFLAGGTKPIEVMEKWMNYLESFYGNEFHFDRFRLFSKAFLIMSECMPVTTTETSGATRGGGEDNVDFRKVYYFLYRVFNNFYLSKNYRDPNTDKYVHDLFLRVLDDIEYSSDNEKIAMYNLVSNWTSVNRNNSLKVYGKSTSTKFEAEEEDIKPTLETTTDSKSFTVLPQPMIPSFNPLCLKSNSSSYSDF